MNSFELGEGFIPDDILFRIFVRLPVKSLIRFKCVCKYWLRLLSSRDFIHHYSAAASSENPMVWFREPYFSNHTFACVDSSGCFSEFTLAFLKVDVVVSYSCNGLLLCLRDGNPGALYVCNPTTREFKLLPKITGRESSMERLSVVGMTVDPSTLSYKVVLGLIITMLQINCFVFDSETNEWMRLVSSGGHGFIDARRQRSASVGCCLCWLAQGHSNIRMLDLSKNELRKIPLPDEIENIPSGKFCLLELEGCLSLIQILVWRWMDIWVLKEKGWIFFDRVNIEKIGFFLPTTPRPIIQNRDFIFLATYSHIMVYCRRNKVWKEVYDVRNRIQLPLVFTGLGYRSTMCPS